MLEAAQPAVRQVKVGDPFVVGVVGEDAAEILGPEVLHHVEGIIVVLVELRAARVFEIDLDEVTRDVVHSSTDTV